MNNFLHELIRIVLKERQKQKFHERMMASFQDSYEGKGEPLNQEELIILEEILD